MVAQANDR
jgi:hypothetical protein